MRYQVLRISTSWVTALTLFSLAGSSSAQTHLGIVSIDNVTNQLSATRLMAGYTHQVAIRYHFPDEPTGPLWAGSNTFELYSPDGADWVDFVESRGPLLASAPCSVTRKYYTSSDDGATYAQTGQVGSNTPGSSTGPESRVAVGFGMLDAGGMCYFPSGTNGIAFYGRFQTRVSDIGRTMCIDTVNGRGTFAWEWIQGTNIDRPQWDNGLGENAPRCWEIAPCCQSRVGDVNITGDDEPTIADVSAMIDAKFISGTCYGILNCLPEADIDQSGGTNPSCDDITIGDISMLIDYLFITGPELGLLNCL